MMTEEAQNELVSPAQCPACRGEWSPTGVCTRCGLSRGEVMAVMRVACTTYNQARQAASEGRFAEARSLLAQVRACGIAAVTRHPAVRRLEELCQIPVGDFTVSARLAAQEERAAHSAVSRCDFRGAAFYAARAAKAQPGNLALQKLHLLTLYGAGQLAEARDVFSRLQQAVPADPDLLRWQRAGEEFTHRGVTGTGPEMGQGKDWQKSWQRALVWVTGCVLGVVTIQLLRGKQGETV